MTMQGLCDIEKVETDGDCYEIKIRIYKGLLPYLQDFLDNLGNMAKELHYKARLAEELSEEHRENHQQKVEKRDNAILEQIRSAYALTFERIKSIRETMKVINRDFKDWWWIRERFKKEIEAQRDFEIMRLISQGLTSIQIGNKLGLHPGTIRKILSNRGGLNSVEIHRKTGIPSPTEK